MIVKEITVRCCTKVFVCDENCNKAWGIDKRPREQLSNDEDDVVFLADDELGDAPTDTGTYDGGHAKPVQKEERPNKWCLRTCERGAIIDGRIDKKLSDFSQRHYNQPWKHTK